MRAFEQKKARQNRIKIDGVTNFLKKLGQVGSGQVPDPTRIFRVDPTGHPNRPDPFGALVSAEFYLLAKRHFAKP